MVQPPLFLGSVIFDKLKVTNNRCTIIQGQICLHSMHKYLPKVFVVPLSSGQTNMNQESLLRDFEEHGIPDYAEEFSFPEVSSIGFASTEDHCQCLVSSPVRTPGWDR